VAARPVGEGSELGGAQLRRQDDSREEVRVLGAGAGVLGVGMGELRLGVGARREKGRDGMETEPTRARGFGSFRRAEPCRILDEYSPKTLRQEPLRSARSRSKHPKNGMEPLGSGSLVNQTYP
jgi:hypothetical protein